MKHFFRLYNILPCLWEVIYNYGLQCPRLPIRRYNLIELHIVLLPWNDVKSVRYWDCVYF